MNYYGSATIVFMMYMIISACCLINGVITCLRGFLLPWLFGMAFVIMFQILWSIWLLYGYYIYVGIQLAWKVFVYVVFIPIFIDFTSIFQIQIVIPAIIYWLFVAYNVSITALNFYSFDGFLVGSNLLFKIPRSYMIQIK